MLIETQTQINVPTDKAWDALISFEQYGAWNPLTPQVDGAPVVGERVRLHVRMLGFAMKRFHRISRLESQKMLAWTIESRFSWWLRGERRQRLEPAPGGGCLYINEEEIRGLGSLFVKLFLGKVLRRSLEAVGLGLKRRVEEGSTVS